MEGKWTEEHNIETHIVKYNNYYDLYTHSKNNTYRLLKFMYENSSISLDRKYKKYVQALEYCPLYK